MRKYDLEPFSLKRVLFCQFDGNNHERNETYFDQAVSGESAFNDVIFDIQELMRKSGVELVEDLFSFLDETINESTQRNKDWHIQRKADEKVVSTTLGDIRLVRHYYQHKENQTFTYLLDGVLKLAPHTRMDLGFKAALLDKAKDVSYQKIIDSFLHSGTSSRSTVMNVAHKELD